MLFILLITSLSVSLIFIFLQHPLSMGFTLLIQSLLISLITGFFNYNFWYSYIIFLIMVGGMLVLFIYMTSIASNEKFIFSNKILLFLMIMMMITLMMYLLLDKFLIYQNFWNQDIHFSNYSWMNSLSKYVNYPTNLIMFLMIIYLFLTLIAIVKITNINYGPLRQKF